MKIIEKIQKSPLIIRKCILLIMVIVVGIFLFFIWSKFFLKRFQDLLKRGMKDEMIEELKIPDLKEKIKENMPQLEIPQLPD